MTRTSRALQTRDATARPVLGGGEIRGRLEIDLSDLPGTIEATWIRETTLGQYDEDNIRANMERGYRALEASELPRYQTLKLPGARGNSSDDGLIRRGGMLLMVRDRTIGEAERQAYAEMTEEAARTVARDTSAPKDGRNFQDVAPEIAIRTDRKGRFSE